jgi:D-serine deaminase-like pyridoxal phosphate-dependent protein
MNPFDQITSPSLLLDKQRTMRNIQRMAEKAQRSSVRFRPHFKTHQSAVIGEWFRSFGVSKIAVSSVRMAEYFSAHGWQDILIAFPVNPREIEAIHALASGIHLELLIESAEVVQGLSSHLVDKTDIWIKADCGAHRTGIPVDNISSFVELTRAIRNAPNLNLRGILTHAGQTYHATSKIDVERIYLESFQKLQTVRKALLDLGCSVIDISWGDTPSCSIVEDLSLCDEIRPGNFVLFDAMQLRVGSCKEEDLAAAVACPVVALHPERGEVVIHGGAIHLSKEFIEFDGAPSYGLVALPNDHGWGTSIPGAYVRSLSQEHGVICIPKKFFSNLHIGDLLVVLPVHSCLVVNLFDHYRTLAGESIPIMKNTSRT